MAAMKRRGSVNECSALDPPAVLSYTSLSLSTISVVLELALVILTMIATRPSAITIRELEKNTKVYYLQDLEITGHTWSLTGCGERKCTQA